MYEGPFDQGWFDRYHFGRVWGAMPIREPFQANFIADFYENENLTFAQWLAWLRRWMWALDSRMNYMDARLTAVEDRTLTFDNTDTVTWANTGAWNKAVMTWDPDLNTTTYSSPSSNIDVKANVAFSNQTTTRSITIAGQAFTWTASNATYDNQGVYTPDVTPVLSELLGRTAGLSNQNDLGLVDGNFSELTKLNAFRNDQYQWNLAFFEKETGLYFSASNMQTGILKVSDKVGNLVGFVTLHPLPGNVIGRIERLFVEYATQTRTYYIEIGCDNETIFAFKLPHADLSAVKDNLIKNCDITEFISYESFTQIIGSENTVMTSNDPDDEWYNQRVTFYNPVSQSLGYGSRRNLYNDANLQTLTVDSQTTDILSTTTDLSCDFYGIMVLTNSGVGNGDVTTAVIDYSKNTVAWKGRVTFNNTTLVNSLLAYANREGNVTQSMADINHFLRYGERSVQIINNSKLVKDPTGELAILITTTFYQNSNDGATGNTANYSRSEVVFGYGDGEASIFKNLVNSKHETADIMHLSPKWNLQLAGLSKGGSFGLNSATESTSDFPNITLNGQAVNWNVITDTPDDYAIGLSKNPMPNPQQGDQLPSINIFESIVKNNRVMLHNGLMNNVGQYKQMLIVTEQIDDIIPNSPNSPSPFSNTIVAYFERVNQVGQVNSQGYIGTWVYHDDALQWSLIKTLWDKSNELGNRDITVTDTNSVNLTKTGEWKNGDVNENIKADAKISNDTTTISLPSRGSFTIPNGTSIHSDGLWSPDYLAALQGINSALNTLAQNFNDYVTSTAPDLKFLQQLYNNVVSGGFYSGGEGTGTFDSGSHFAYGNINLFGGTEDGSNYIRTNNGSTEDDITAGI